MEVRGALLSMSGWKAPSPDGLPPIFFQEMWQTTHRTLCDWLLEVFKNPMLLSEVNSIYITMIPKVDKLENYSHFRLISLCNITYKVVTKIVASRLREVMEKLVSPRQCSFVPGRCMADNILVAQEVVHSMRMKKGSKGWMAIKLDLEKVYDQMD